MIKKKRIIIILGIITIGLFIYKVNFNKKDMVINEEFLKPSEIEHLEVVGMDNNQLFNISDHDDLERIIYILQQLNGPIEIEYAPANEALLGLSIVLKGHYPSSAIIISQDNIFLNGQGRMVSGELVNQLVRR